MQTRSWADLARSNVPNQTVVSPLSTSASSKSSLPAIAPTSETANNALPSQKFSLPLSAEAAAAVTAEEEEALFMAVLAASAAEEEARQRQQRVTAEGTEEEEETLISSATGCSSSCANAIPSLSSSPSSPQNAPPRPHPQEQEQEQEQGGTSTTTTGSSISLSQRPAAVVGKIGTDAWNNIFSYCRYPTLLRLARTCHSLRRLSLKPSLWYHIKEAYIIQYEADVGHRAPPEMVFAAPVEMSSLLMLAPSRQHQKEGGGTPPPQSSPSSSSFNNNNNTFNSPSTGFGVCNVAAPNEAAAEFIRYSRYLALSETRMWHLADFKQSYAPIADEALRFAYVASFDSTIPLPSYSSSSSSSSGTIPITVTAVQRTAHPFLRPSDVSTVFSHQAANALAACRLRTHDVTASYAPTSTSLHIATCSAGLDARNLPPSFLTRLGCALCTPSVQRDLGRVLVSAALIELSMPEALGCLDGRALLQRLIKDVIIEEHETRFFAIRQLSTESNIAIILVDPILTLVVAPGPTANRTHY